MALRERTASWIAVAAVAVAAAALFASCSDEDAGKLAYRASALREAPATSAPSAARSRRPMSAGAANDADPNGELAASTSAAQDDGEFPSIYVRVVRADGTAAAGAIVYALPAGAPGRERVGDGPCEKTGNDGLCRMVLPKFGKFDVGARARQLLAMQTDVVVPRDDPVLLTLPEEAEVELVADAAALELLAARIEYVGVEARTSIPSLVERVPGRADPRTWFVSALFTRSDNARVRVPAGETVRIRTSPGLRTWPVEATPPARVQVSSSGLRYGNWRIVLTPPDVLARTHGWLTVQIDLGDGRPARAWTVWVRHGAIDEHYARAGDYAWFPAEGCVARWHGRGVAPGECVVPPLTPAIPATVELVMVLDGTALAPEPNTPKIKVRPTERGTDTEPPRGLLHSDAGSRCRVNVQPDGLGHMGSDLPAWVGAVHGNRASHLLRVEEEPATPIELPLLPGGMLVVDCPTTPPKELGSIKIARKDGRPLPLTGLDLFAEIDAVTGNTIGPLPAGDYTFVIRLCGIDVGEVTATVGAGERETLRIPRLPIR